MTPTERGPATLIGRDRELTDLTAFLAAAAVRPMVMALLGEAGVGKTALLGAAAVLARERGFRVLRLAPDGLRGLFAPPPGPAARYGPLDERLSAWLAGGPRMAPADEPALLTAMVLRLERLAAGGPVLVLLDRADQADGESLELLAQVLGLCTEERVSLLLATRGSEPPDALRPIVVRYRVRPLTDDAAARLLDTLPGENSGRIRHDLLRRAAGNPLALAWIGDPAAPLPDEFRHLVDDLPAATRRLVLHAALAGEAEPVATVNGAGGGSADLFDWAPAERAGLVAVAGGRVRFTHPLIRETRVAAAGRDEVRQAYRNLAARTDDQSRRASYHAAATDGPDEPTAAALEQAADAAERQARYLAAARALQEAARHSPQIADAARRYARAVFAAYRTGEPAWTLALYREMPPQAYDPDVLGVAAAGAGLALVQLADPVHAFELTEAAARRWPRDGQITLTVVAVAATAAMMSGRAEHLRLLPGLIDLIGESLPDGLGASMIPPSVTPYARASVLAAADPAGAPADDPGTGTMTGPAEVARMLFTGTTAWLRDDSARATAELTAVWQAQRHSDAPGSLVARLPMLILALLDGGRWADAAKVLDEAEHLAAVGGVPLLRIVLPALRAILQAWTADGSSCSSLPEAPPGNGFAASVRHRALGLSRLAVGDHEGSYAHFRALFDASGEPVHYFLGPRSLPQLALTAGLAGRTEEARKIVAGCRRAAGEEPVPRLALLVSHATALLDDSDGAEAHFARAIGDPDRGQQWPLEFAEAQFTYALWLRRRHRVRDSRPLLHAALETFQRLGARAHAEAAGKYLPGSGRRAATEAFATLSPQKQQIAQLAAAGLTNQQIGRRLALSPRTVGSHLYQIFPVLGVDSRHRLRELLADPAAPTGTES